MFGRFSSYVVLGAVLVALFGAIAVGQTCNNGCWFMSHGCKAQSGDNIYAEWEPRISWTFNDIHAMTGLTTTGTVVITRWLYTGVQDCECYYTQCTYPCMGSEIGGTSNQDQILFTTRCYQQGG
jgi:hypothetical protein